MYFFLLNTSSYSSLTTTTYCYLTQVDLYKFDKSYDVRRRDHRIVRVRFLMNIRYSSPTTTGDRCGPNNTQHFACWYATTGRMQRTQIDKMTSTWRAKVDRRSIQPV